MRDVSPGKRKRVYIDPPTKTRCIATIVLRDGSTARCGRSVSDGQKWCWQHKPTFLREAPHV